MGFLRDGAVFWQVLPRSLQFPVIQLFLLDTFGIPCLTGERCVAMLCPSMTQKQRHARGARPLLRNKAQIGKSVDAVVRTVRPCIWLLVLYGIGALLFPAPRVEALASVPTANCGGSPLHGRKQAVAAAIVDQLSGIADCSQVAQADLAAVLSLDLSRQGLAYLQAEDFAQLSNLERLDLSSNGLAFLPAGLFDGTPNLKALNLESNQLVSLPEAYFFELKQLESLALGGNFLASMPNGSFAGLENLHSLDLRFNQLTTVPADLFAGLSQLEHLDLSYNGLTRVPAGLLAGAPNVKALHLGDNALTYLPPGFFAPLKRLEELRLNNNGLTSWSGDAYADWGHLRVLDLSINSLTSLSGQAFASMSQLTELHLGSNALLAPLPPDLFAGLDRLQTLTLNEIHLTQLPPGLFAGLRSLQTLVLGANPLGALPAVLFAGLNNLQFLALDNLQLAVLPPELFAGLDRLQYLRLSYNRLTFIPPGLLADLTQLEHLDLMANSLTAAPSSLFTGLSRFRTLERGGNPLAPTRAALNLAVGGIGPDRLHLTWTAPPERGRTLKGYAVRYRALGDREWTEHRHTDLATETVITGLTADTHYGVAVSALYAASPALETEILAATADPSFPAGPQLELKASTGLNVYDEPSYASEVKAWIDGHLFGADRFQILGKDADPPTWWQIGFFDGNIGWVPGERVQAYGDLRTVPVTWSPISTGLRPLPAAECEGGLLHGRTRIVVESLVSQVPGVEECRNVKAEHLAAVISLPLAHQGLTQLQPTDLMGLSALEDLDLGYNGLDSLPDGLLDELTQLKHLSLNNNRLSALPIDAFARLRRLEILDLGHNQLEAWPSGQSDGLAHLNYLDLQHNRIAVLPDYAFAAMRLLSVLDLSHNRLTHLSDFTLAGMGNLLTLRLQNNQLTSVAAHAFAEAPNMAFLDLGANPLPGLPARLFAGLTLQRLDAGDIPLLPEEDETSTSRLAVARMGHDSVQLTWTTPHPARAASPAEYAVQYRVQGSDDWIHRGSVARGTAIAISGLDAATTYVVTVTPLRGTGFGPSMEIQVTTSALPETPAPQPDPLAVTGVDVFIYSGPGLDYEITGFIKSDRVYLGEPDDVGELVYEIIGFIKSDGTDKFTVVGKDADPPAWWHIRLSDTEVGWVPSGSVPIFGDVSGVPVTGHLWLAAPAAVSMADCGQSPLHGRTAPVVAAIVAHVPEASRCQDVTPEHLARLLALDVTYRDLTHVRRDDFAGLPRLQYLNLSGNALPSVPSGIFRELVSLQELDLSDNRLTDLPAHLLAGLYNLRTLRLRRNQLTVLPDNLFADTHRLEVLIMNENRLTDLPAGLFVGLKDLWRLDLYGNLLPVLSEDRFAALDSLAWLNGQPVWCGETALPSRRRATRTCPDPEPIAVG